MRVILLATFSLALTLVQIGAEDIDENGILHVNEAWAVRPHGQIYKVQNYKYPEDVPINILQTWMFQTYPRGHALRLICYDLRLPSLVKGGCGDWGFTVIDGDEDNGKDYCGGVKGLNILTKHDELRIKLRTGDGGTGRVNCTVQGREIGPHGELPDLITTTPQPPTLPPTLPPKPSYLDVESEEIDSSEHGVSPGRTRPTCACGWTNKQNSRIVGGREAKVHEYPYVVTVGYAASRYSIFCGGSLITPYHVLTAAHCTVKESKAGRKLAVLVGEHNYWVENDTNKTQFIEVSKIIEHENFDTSNGHNDIALLVLETKVEFNRFIGPICLPWRKMDMDNTDLKVLGWGMTEHGGPVSRVLKTVHVRTVPTEECKGEKTPLFICVYATERGSCNGDSGGPVIWLDPDTNRYTLVGLVSHGGRCGGMKPIVNTDVSNYIDWINTKVRETNPEAQMCRNYN